MALTPIISSHKPLLISLLTVTIDGWWNSDLLLRISPSILLIKTPSAACLLKRKKYDFAPKSNDFAPNLPHQIITISHQIL